MCDVASDHIHLNMRPAQTELRLTFVTPHQRPNSGGVYTIQQFARHCAPLASVNLVVEKGEPRALSGVRVSAAGSCSSAEIPDADVLLIPADSRRGAQLYDLPARHGVPVLFFQGYGTPGDPVVKENLARARLVACGASWLVEEACGSGCSAWLVRYGLDRSIFSCEGRRSEPDGLAVGMMCGQVSWKGATDGLEALHLVQQEVPGLRILLFGVEDPVYPGARFLACPPAQRSEIATLMRACEIFVCSSWEEGFGLPGVEALACGAALATTDTKGSRDYALAGETALVSAPRDPRGLADNILQLVRDGSLRQRLGDAGRRLIDAQYPSWPQAAAMFAERLTARLGIEPSLLTVESASDGAGVGT